MEALFTEIYDKNTFGGTESRSGHGSSLANTAAIRAALPALLAKLAIRTLLDIPCGDFHWLKEVDLGSVRYIGADIVGALIRENDRNYGREGRIFVTLDITRDALPYADLILCRDCLVHFSDEDIFRAITNLRRSGAKYLLTTTFTDRSSNEDILTGGWRPLNLQIAPFCFPEPITVICEDYHDQGGAWADLSLGLWEVATLPDFGF